MSRSVSGKKVDMSANGMSPLSIQRPVTPTAKRMTVVCSLKPRIKSGASAGRPLLSLSKGAALAILA
jgi:hypothetical protein